MMNSTILRCTNLTKKFHSTTAVSNLTFEIAQGETLAILGPSGCGKTTVLRLIAGFETPETGSIHIAGQSVSGPKIFVPPENRNVGMVFQDYALFPHLSVEKNVGYGISLTPIGNLIFNRTKYKQDVRQYRARVTRALSLVGVQHLSSRMPNELSGGEQQRVALARALVTTPDLLLMDEPFSNLDAKLRNKVREEVKEILTLSGVTVVFVTHDQEEAFYFGDKVAVLNHGRIEQIDTPEVIYRSPRTTFVARFVGVADFLKVNLVEGIPQTEAGQLNDPLPVESDKDLYILVRPHDIDLGDSEHGRGRIISRMFQGSSYLYRVLLDSGEIVHSLQSNSSTHNLDKKVDVKFKPNRRLKYYQNGSLVE